MNDIILVRTSYLKIGTIGQLLDSDGLPICLTLERPWLDNAVNISCIPEGEYNLLKDIRHRGRKDEMEVWEFQNVPGRTQIQFHIANQVDELLGCIAPVSRFYFDHGVSLYGSSSRPAFENLMDKLKDNETATIQIKNQACFNSFALSDNK